MTYLPSSLPPSLALSLLLTRSPSHSLSARLLKMKEAILQGMDFLHFTHLRYDSFYQKDTALLLITHRQRDRKMQATTCNCFKIDKITHSQEYESLCD